MVKTDDPSVGRETPRTKDRRCRAAPGASFQWQAKSIGMKRRSDKPEKLDLVHQRDRGGHRAKRVALRLTVRDNNRMNGNAS